MRIMRPCQTPPEHPWVSGCRVVFGQRVAGYREHRVVGVAAIGVVTHKPVRRRLTAGIHNWPDQ